MLGYYKTAFSLASDYLIRQISSFNKITMQPFQVVYFSELQTFKRNDDSTLYHGNNCRKYRNELAFPIFNVATGSSNKWEKSRKIVYYFINCFIDLQFFLDVSYFNYQNIYYVFSM